MTSVLLELGLIISLAAILSIVGRLIKQPPIVAYLIAGVLSGPLVFNIIQSTESIQTFARMGIVFLLFIVGLSLDFRVLRDVGKVAITVGFGQVIITAFVGFLIAIGLGFGHISALYLAAALAFSSTIVAVKLLSDKNEIDALHGKISIGVLIVQDFIAALALMIIPFLNGGAMSVIFLQLAKSLILISATFIVGYLIIPLILPLAAKNRETLFLFSVGWALVVAIIFESLEFSMEIGALLAGMTLASSKYHFEIKSKIKGVGDFFIVLFFVFFGSQLIGPISSEIIIQALVFSGFVLIGNPIIVMFLMKFQGYKKRVNFLSGINLAQISEFSLILVLLGFTLGHIPKELFTLTILVALITIALSSYLIQYSQPIYKRISWALSIFNGDRKEPGTANKSKNYDIILLGYNRLSFNLLKAFNQAKKNYLIIDFNPETISKLSQKGINCIYGDVNDVEFLSSIKLNKAKIVVSTIPDSEINLKVIDHIKNKNIVFIPTSHNIKESMNLYKAGADYVIMPHFLGGDFMAHLLVKDNFKKKLIKLEGKKQIKELKHRLSEGHKHPETS